jgi:hypothetical protein
VLEVLITERCPTKWEWRVCDRQGATIMNGGESTRRAAKYRGYRALFYLLGFGWNP